MRHPSQYFKRTGVARQISRKTPVKNYNENILPESNVQGLEEY